MSFDIILLEGVSEIVSLSLVIHPPALLNFHFRRDWKEHKMSCQGRTRFAEVA